MGTPNNSGQVTTLNRWLNINLVSRNRRTRGYLSIDTSNLPPNPGVPFVLQSPFVYSQKIIQINVSCDHNFSIPPIERVDGVFPFPLGDTVLWTVSVFDIDASNETGYNVIKRYILNTPAADYNVPNIVGVYNGEVIPAALYNVAFEAWNLDGIGGRINAVDTFPIYTSVLSPSSDIRNAGTTGFQVSTDCGAHYGFNNTSVSSIGLFDLPITFPYYNFQFNI